MGHATILAYGETCSRSFPLILCVGREPNTDQPIEPGAGSYDFDGQPYCGFWNTSYGMVARVVHQDPCPRRLKDLCRSRTASPLVYADVLPIGLKYWDNDKATARVAVPEEHVAQHLQNIFSLTIIIRRVRLVLLSGLDGPRFQRAALLAQEACNQCQIRHTSVPFFVGNNTEAIQHELTTEDRDIIKEVYRVFLAH